MEVIHMIRLLVITGLLSCTLSTSILAMQKSVSELKNELQHVDNILHSSENPTTQLDAIRTGKKLILKCMKQFSSSKSNPIVFKGISLLNMTTPGSTTSAIRQTLSDMHDALESLELSAMEQLRKEFLQNARRENNGLLTTLATENLELKTTIEGLKNELDRLRASTQQS
jgi:hypothetical protein